MTSEEFNIITAAIRDEYHKAMAELNSLWKKAQLRIDEDSTLLERNVYCFTTIDRQNYYLGYIRFYIRSADIHVWRLAGMQGLPGDFNGVADERWRPILDCTAEVRVNTALLFEKIIQRLK